MKLTGKVQNGVIVLPPGLELPEGMEVDLVPLGPLPTDPPFLQVALRLAKKRDWPADFSLNHGHYVSGEPKKE